MEASSVRGVTRHDYRETIASDGGPVEVDPWGRRWIACARCGMRRFAWGEESLDFYNSENCPAPVETLPCLN